MEELSERQPTRNQELVRKNGGFSGYSAEATTRPEQINDLATRREPHTRSKDQCIIGISSRCHIELIVSSE